MLFHNEDIFCYINSKTDSKVYVNTNHQSFCVVPEANFSEMKKLGNLFTDQRLGSGGKRLFKPEQIEVIERLLDSDTHDKFKSSFTALYDELLKLRDCTSGSLSKQRSYLMKLIFRLWAEGIILFPAGVISQNRNCINEIYTNVNWTNDELSSGNLYEVLESIHKHSFYESANTNERVIRRLRELISCIGPVKDLSVLNKDAVDGILGIMPFDNKRDMKYLYRGLQAVTGLQEFLLDEVLFPYSELASKTEDMKITRTKRFDFMWCIVKDSNLEEWRRELADWFTTLVNKKDVSNIITAANKLLDYLVDHPDVTRNPIEYINSGNRDKDLKSYVCSGLTKQQSHQQYLSIIYTFFEHMLDKYATADDGEEGTYRLPGFTNPISIDDIPPQNVRASQTHRIAMPRLLVKTAMEIIKENDFAWCKKIDEDHFLWIHPETGRTETIWSPVRACALLLKMLLPLRTYQVRMLDTGEGDPEWFDDKKFEWVPNTGKHANYWKSGCGFLRKIYDPELCKYVTGFFINTNKTQDRETLFMETGYEIPWEYKEVIHLACFLRDFQEKYNPVARPTAYTELIHENHVPTQDVAERIPHRFYLFRDPCKPIKSLPVTDGRLAVFWRKLLKELEKRMKNKGYGEITLVHGQRGCEFDLHSLRVTGLTMLAEKGVPIEMLSKIVAGHATILMTLYYTKFNIGHVTDTLNEAQWKADQKAQAEFADFLKANPLASIKKAVAFNSEDALQFSFKTDSAVWRFLDYGICPVGCTKCAEGGQPVVDHADRKIYTPVPGGTMNCACCRFFLTGPPFLGPLVAKYNEMINVLDVCGSDYRKHLAESQRIERDKVNAENDGKTFTDMKSLRIAEGNVDEAMEKLDVCGMTCHHLYNLIHQALALQKNYYDKSNNNFALIYQGAVNELEAHLVEASKYDLYDDICQSGVYYKSINTSMAKLQRKNLFYRMLIRNGKGAMLLSLDDDNIEKAINAANRLMYKRLGRKATNQLIDGQLSLDAIDGKFTQALESAISEEIGQPLRLNDSLIGIENKQTLLIEGA